MDPVSAAMIGKMLEQPPVSRALIHAAYSQMLADGMTTVPLLTESITPEQWLERELKKATS